MLVLSRKEEESVVIADGIITITIIEIRGDKVRLGFEAPRDIDIHRSEVFNAIKRNQTSQQDDNVVNAPLQEVQTLPSDTRSDSVQGD